MASQPALIADNIQSTKRHLQAYQTTQTQIYKTLSLNTQLCTTALPLLHSFAELKVSLNFDSIFLSRTTVITYV